MRFGKDKIIDAWSGRRDSYLVVRNYVVTCYSFGRHCPKSCNLHEYLSRHVVKLLKRDENSPQVLRAGGLLSRNSK